MLKHLSHWRFGWLTLICLTHILSAQPVAEDGVLDARTFDFSSDRLNLAGTWVMFDQQLIASSDIVDKEGHLSTFPQLWNDIRKGGQGVATYHLKVLVDQPGELALDLPQMYSSYALWINNQLIARNGTPGTTSLETLPQWKPQTISFPVNSDTLDLVLQVSNFSHFKGGCKDPIYLGSSSRMLTHQDLSNVSKLIEFGTLFVVAIVFLFVYFQQGRKKLVIYFALICLTWAVRSVFSNDYTFIHYFPDFSWAAMVRIEYITLYLTMMWAMLYVGRIFNQEISQIVKYLLVTLNGSFVAFTLFTAPVDFTRFLPVYLVTAGVVLVYGAGVVLLALINDRQGANLLTISVVLGLATFSYDIFTYEGFFTYNSLLFSAAYIVIFLLMGLALLIKLGIVKSASRPTTMLTYKDLYGDQK
jgi:hypothetical protein